MYTFGQWLIEMWDSFIWWILNENKNCHSFCPKCPYFNWCVVHTKIGKDMEE